MIIFRIKAKRGTLISDPRVTYCIGDKFVVIYTGSWFPDFTLGSSLFGAVKLAKNVDLDVILDMVLDLMHGKVSQYVMVVGLVKV